MNAHTQITRAHYISVDETLLIYVKDENGVYIAETDYHGTTYANKDAVLAKLENAGIADQVTRISRLDLDRDKPENITEELAEAYYNAIPLHDRPYSWEEDTLPHFVRESEFWETVCEDEDIPRDDYSEHNTHWVVNGGVFG